MKLSQYKGRLVRATDRWGNTVTGTAESFPPEYGLREQGREEESIRLGKQLLFASDLVNIELLPTLEEAEAAIPPGRYRHFKGREYEVLAVARHSETEEPMVVYRPLYGEGGLWVRPAAMWNETVERDGKRFRRFQKIEE